MNDVFATLVSGMLTGAVWSLLALAFVVVFRATDVFNFATPEIGTLGAYVGLVTFVGFGWPIWMAGVGAIVVSGLASVIVERLLIRPLGADAMFPAVVVTFGLALMLESITDSIWGYLPIRVDLLVEGTTTIFGLVVSNQRLLTFVIAVAAMIAVALFFKFTQSGVAMLATAEDREAARMLGVDTIRLGQYAWLMGGMLAGLSAFLLAGQSFLTTSLMAAATIRAFAGMFLGGINSMVGVVIGGFMIGLLENVASRYVSVELTYTTMFTIMLVVLLVRPAGLFGSHAAARA